MSGLEDIARTIHAASCDCDNPERYEYSVANAEQAKAVRDYLLSDEAVERAARALYESSPRPWTWEEILDGWRNKPYPDYPHTVDDLMAQARAALTAALGGRGR